MGQIDHQIVFPLLCLPGSPGVPQGPFPDGVQLPLQVLHGLRQLNGLLSRLGQLLCRRGQLPDGTHYLCPATVELAMRNHPPGMAQGRGLSFYLPAYDNGYTGDLFPRETVGHTGFTGTSFALDPTSGLYVIFLTNRICPSRDSLEIYRVRRLLHNAVYAAASR